MDVGKADTLKHGHSCLLYTSDAADEEDSVDVGGESENIKKNNHIMNLLHASVGI